MSFLGRKKEPGMAGEFDLNSSWHSGVRFGAFAATGMLACVALLSIAAQKSYARWNRHLLGLC